MTPEIINLIFPTPLPTPAEIEAKYPKRVLPEGAKVTRVAPSPTGKMHIGTVYTAFLNERIAHQSKGIFYLRLEDTDQKRKEEGAVKLIKAGLGRYGIATDEGVAPDGTDVGAYGPYTQSLRKEIYQAFVKSLLEQGLAYPCFCAAEDLDIMRKIQEKTSVRPGYYGKYAKCRHLTDDQILENLKAGKPFVIRFKSPGNYDKRMIIKDLIKGDLALPENDIDVIIMKGDGLPTYHFAHAVDDHLMGTTHVIRADEWVSSIPLHIQLFVALGWKAPKYGHIAPLQKIDNGKKRKLSKRHDPEAGITYFWEKGYPETALIEYMLNLINANFEDWRRNNPDKDAFEFPVNAGKISNAAGALFDFVKLNSIAKDVVARMSAQEVYTEVVRWAKEYNKPFAERLEANPDYVTRILNIERNIGKKSRKDIMKWEDVESDLTYFFDDLFTTTKEEKMTLLAPLSQGDVQMIADEFSAVYNPDEDKDTWFAHIKEIAEKHGFATDMKAYKENPTAFKGNVSDVAKVLRILVTGRDKSPDLHEIMQILGTDKVKSRLHI